MQTQTVMPSPQLPPPAILGNRALLTQMSSATRVTETGNVASEELTVRATQVTVVLKKILEQTGHRHGGINE
jgi:hypothetical protein